MNLVYLMAFGFQKPNLFSIFFNHFFETYRIIFVYLFQPCRQNDILQKLQLQIEHQYGMMARVMSPIISSKKMKSMVN